jgi:hypothetical protein
MDGERLPWLRVRRAYGFTGDLPGQGTQQQAWILVSVTRDDGTQLRASPLSKIEASAARSVLTGGHRLIVGATMGASNNEAKPLFFTVA